MVGKMGRIRVQCFFSIFFHFYVNRRLLEPKSFPASLQRLSVLTMKFLQPTLGSLSPFFPLSSHRRNFFPPAFIETERWRKECFLSSRFSI